MIPSSIERNAKRLERRDQREARMYKNVKRILDIIHAGEDNTQFMAEALAMTQKIAKAHGIKPVSHGAILLPQPKKPVTTARRESVHEKALKGQGTQSWLRDE